MDVKKLKWCCNQNKGLRIIEPNKNLAEEYIKSAEETLLILKNIENKSNMWLSTTIYYTEYFSVYALCMRLGIKSEIHDCTIELVKFFEKEKLIIKGFSKKLERDKELRIDNQYYLKNRKADLNFDNLRDFVLYIKKLISTIGIDDVNNIRNKLKEALR